MKVSLIRRMQLEFLHISSKLKRRPFLTAVSVNLIVLLLVLVFCEIKYETSDDYIMAAIMAGDYGESPNPHMIFINVLWGYFLLPFYSLLPQISWYLISQLFLCFCSFTVITYLMLKKLDIMMALMLTTLFITFFSDDAYIMVQFTKTAIIAVMSGSVLFLQALFHKKVYYKRELLIGGMLVFMGSLIRFNVIYIVGGFLLIIILVEFIQFLYTNDTGKWKSILKLVVTGVVLIGTVIGAKELDQYIYNSDEAYVFFENFNNVRGNIVDKRDYGYEVCAEKYQEIGLSKNDYTLMRTWNFADTDFYTLSRMKKAQTIISDYQATQSVDRDSVRYDLRGRNYWSYPGFFACIILFLLSIFLNKKYWWISLFSSVNIYLYLYYFVASGKIVYRIEYAVFFCAFLTMIYFWDKLNCRKSQNKLEICNICVILIMLLCIYQVPTYRLNPWAKEIKGEEYKNYIEDVFFESWNYDSRRYRCSTYNPDAFSELQAEMEGNRNNFYFLNFSTTIQTLYLASNPWINDKLEKNSSYLAGVTTNFPDSIKLLENNKVENPIKSLLNDNVYLVDNYYQEEILTYIKEHYYPEARKALYKTIDGFQIWKFYKK